MGKKIYFCTICIWLVITYTTFVFAEENNIIEQTKDNYNLEETLNALEEYTEELNLTEISESLLKGERLDVKSLLDVLTNKIFKELKIEIKTFVKLLIVIILIAIIKCLELEKGSLDKIVDLISFLVITTMILKNYTDIIELFKSSVGNLTKITEIVSPVLLTLLIATGEIVTSGIIGPSIMFLTSLVGVVVNVAVLPLLNIALVFKIISGISDTVNLDKLGGFLNKFAMWATSIVFALILGVLGLETSVSTSVDSITVKTTQAAVSNLIPVVGKFVSDSAELVMGASELIGKTIGVIGIVVLVIAVMLPAIKILLIGVIYGVLESLAETLLKDDKISKIIGTFSKQYNSLAGIMIGVGTVFIIAMALAISLLGKVVGS